LDNIYTLYGDSGDRTCIAIDANHFLKAGRMEYAVTLTVNTSTWAVTTTGTAVAYEPSWAKTPSFVQIDTNHFACFWQSGSGGDGYTETLVVNTTTWTVTTASAVLEFDTQNAYRTASYKIDTNHFLGYWMGGASSYPTVQAFAVNTSTWEVTTAAALKVIDAHFGNFPTCEQIDANHFIIVGDWRTDGSNDYGNAVVLTVNTSDWTITTAAAIKQFYAATYQYNSTVKIDNGHYVNFFQGDAGDGFAQVLKVALPAVGPANLKSYNTNLAANIKSINTNLIANVKTLNTNA
jgi:hypothetical protein